MENNTYRFEVHYYLKNNSHSMNAFIRNKAERDLLEAFKRIGETLDSELTLETETYQEGGLREIIAIGIVSSITFLSPSINDIIAHHFTKDAEIEQLDKKIKEETLKNLQLDSVKKELEIKEKIDQKLNDKLTKRHVSNFYKKIDGYEKVEKIGFKCLDNNKKEYVVNRSSFKNFILEDNTTTTEDNEALIEIISPVLKDGKYKWRGRYLGEKIDFSMGDYGYKTDVIKGKYTFSNGSLIECRLQITITYDEFGDEKRKSYSVREVYGVSDDGSIRMREAGIKRNHNRWLAKYDNGSLFDEDE